MKKKKVDDEIDIIELSQTLLNNKLKVLLANEVTTLCHSKDKAKNVEVESKKIRDSVDIDSNIIKECKKKYLLKKNL